MHKYDHHANQKPGKQCRASVQSRAQAHKKTCRKHHWRTEKRLQVRQSIVNQSIVIIRCLLDVLTTKDPKRSLLVIKCCLALHNLKKAYEPTLPPLHADVNIDVEAEADDDPDGEMIQNLGTRNQLVTLFADPL